ncbi:MAG TPA: thioesterase family protein [Dyella sp.]|uniref:acyl-CoA thioesterase n=1 Tax=Dyella sp. TaxID=1869338 RepID=UPI002F939831
MSSNTTAATNPLLDTIISVRWRDLDAFNHVNNSNYLTYLEEARLQWLQKVPGEWMNAQAMPVMAASEIDYRRPIAWPARVRVQLFNERTGNSSMSIGHRMIDADDAETVYCEGRVVMVWMNPQTGKSVPLPQAVRDAAA